DQIGMGDAVGVDEDDHIHFTGRSRAEVASPGGAVAVVFLADQSHVERGRLHDRADVGLGAVVGDDHRQLAGGTLQTGQRSGQEVGPVVDGDDDGRRQRSGGVGVRTDPGPVVVRTEGHVCRASSTISWGITRYDSATRSTLVTPSWRETSAWGCSAARYWSRPAAAPSR